MVYAGDCAVAGVGVPQVALTLAICQYTDAPDPR